MSWEHQPGDGAYGAHAVNDATGARPAGGPHQENGEPSGAPNVYHPYGDAEPEYGRYADPAAAHGWQNAYDETQQLPPVSCGGDQAAVTCDTPDGGPGPEAHGGGHAPVHVPRAGSRRRARPAPRFRLPRPAVVAAGALGAVGIAVALAGAFSSGPSGAPGGTGESARPNVKPSLPLPEGAASSGSETSADPTAGATGSPSAGASSSASGAGGDPAGSPVPTATAPGSSPSAAPTGTADAVRKPGRGHGATKGPR